MIDLVTTRQPIRLVEGTHGQYRYVNPDELVEGMTALMVDVDAAMRNLNDVQFTATTVDIDPDPLFDNHGTPSVKYHCTSPAWEPQCFTPVTKFTTGFADRDDYHPGGPRLEFWVSTR